MQRRTLLAVGAVAAIAALALTGCSNTSSGSGDKTVTVFATTDYKAAYDELVKDFEAANPGVTVEITYAKSDDIATTEPTQLQSGGGADVLSVQPGLGGNAITVGSLQKNGYPLDLSGESWAKQIPDSLRSSTDYEGKTYLYPGVLQPLGAFYNTQAVKAAGLTIPTTWTELLSYCAAAKSAGEVAFSLGFQDQWVTQLVPYALAPTLVYGPDPGWNSDLVAGKVTFPDSAWKTVEDQYLDMNTAGCFSADPNGISFDNTLPPVAKGDALGIVQVGGVFGNLQDQNKDVVYDLEPLPATDNASDTYMAASPGVGLGVNAKAQHQDLAIKFVDFMAEAANINKFATTLGGVVPAVGGDGFAPAPVLKTFNDYVVNGKVSAFPDGGWPNAAVQNAHLVGIQNLFLGKATTTQVLQSMQDALKG